MTENIEIIPDPILRYLNSSVHYRIPSNLPDVPDSLEKATSVDEGDLIYLRAPSQLMTESNGNSSTSGFTHSFYPGHIRETGGELYFVSLTRMPSYPPGYGLDHQPGTALSLRNLDQKEFYKKVAR